MNGNINTNIKIINWNKGNAKYSNQQEAIEFILNKHQPDIMTIQEINITKEDDINLFQVEGYKLKLDQLYDQLGRARAGICSKRHFEV